MIYIATAQKDMDCEWASIISLSIYIMLITCILYNTSPVSRRSRLSRLSQALTHVQLLTVSGNHY